MTGKKIGRYEIKSELGRGGMATVFRAYDPQFKRDVAIKVLPKEFLHDKEFRSRFEREATTIAALEHSAIVPVYDFGEEDGQPYLVMRFMGGDSLQERIDQGALPLDEVIRIIDRVAPALDYAHSQGVIHRDLKPDNILFDQQNIPYLADFGIAKLAETSATLTGNAIVGTPAYMSPEQGRGDPDIDGRSDIYSLGAIVFEMLSGQLPYSANTPTGLIMKQLTEPIPNILDVNNDLPAGVQAVIAQALAKRKYVRFSTATELAEILAAAARGEEIAIARAVNETMALPKDQIRATGTRQKKRTRPSQSKMVKSSQSNRGSKSKNTSPPLIKWLLVIVFIGFAGYGAFYIFNNFISANQVPYVAALDNLTPTPEGENPVVDTSHPTSTDIVQLSEEPTLTPELILNQESTATEQPSATPLPTPSATPSGPVIGMTDKLAFVSDNDIWISNLDGTETERLTTSGGSKFNTQWTPDGQSVTFIAGKCVQAVHIETSQVSTIFCANWSNYIGGFESSPNGQYIALSLHEGLYILPYDFNMLSQIRTKEQLVSAQKCTSYTEAPTKAIRWSNDNKSIAVIANVTDQGRQVDMIKVFDVSRCGQPPVRIDEFPGVRFDMKRYNIDPTLVDFDWNGEALFALAVNTINEFGEIYIYNLVTQRAEIITPIEGRCCYKSFRWSPDDEYFMFAYQDQRYGEGADLYYVIYGTIGTGATYEPIPFSDEILKGTRENPQPSFRPTQ